MARTRREPARTCVGCRQEAGKARLIRLCRGPDGTVAADPGGRAPGRGAYLHRDPGCIEQARRRRALERALKAPVPESVWESLLEGEAPLPSREGLGEGDSADRSSQSRLFSKGGVPPSGQRPGRAGPPAPPLF